MCLTLSGWSQTWWSSFTLVSFKIFVAERSSRFSREGLFLGGHREGEFVIVLVLVSFGVLATVEVRTCLQLNPSGQHVSYLSQQSKRTCPSAYEDSAATNSPS